MAARAQLSEAQVELLRTLRKRNVVTRQRIEMLRDGRLGLHENGPNGPRDITHEAIELAERELSENERILAEYDPEGLTAEPIEGEPK